jgi:putative mRNA 3-end processing factor
LFISDHVDWKDILQTIENTQPKQVWTLHGNGTHLKKYFGDKIVVKILN